MWVKNVKLETRKVSDEGKSTKSKRNNKSVK